MAIGLQVFLNTRAIDSQFLFTSAVGFLRFNDISSLWELSHKPIPAKELNSESIKIAIQLTNEGLHVGHPFNNEATLIKKINDFFTRQFFCTQANSPHSELRFNSKISGCEYLSNFFPTLIVDSVGKVYPSAESYYQIQKIKKLDQTQPLPSTLDPLKLKKLGENIESIWLKNHPSEEDKTKLSAFKIKLMNHVVDAKFDQNPVLRDHLKATGDLVLVEQSATDDFFGSSEYGKGHNNLGKILMETREKILA